MPSHCLATSTAFYDSTSNQSRVQPLGDFLVLGRKKRIREEGKIEKGEDHLAMYYSG
jgi:hypothetical protein